MLASNHLGRTLVTKLLLKHGARIDVKDKEGEEPIHVAAAEGRGDLILLLADAGTCFKCSSVQIMNYFLYLLFVIILRDFDSFVFIVKTVKLQ